MEHGKKWTYVKYKCRCAACVTANAVYMTEYRRRNKAKILAKEKERYRRQKDAIIQRARCYYRREKDAIIGRRRTELGRTKRVLWEQARKARKLKQFVEEVDPQVLLDSHGAMCGICGGAIRGPFHVDHVVPLSRGGEHSYTNTQPAHAKCNEHKHARME
jgi:5-methylcytosine-specific restriction endonuclease McrA